MELSKYIEHTLLKQDATKAEVLKTLQEAKEYNFRCVCVNPVNVKLASDYLKEFWYTIPFFLIAFGVFVTIIFRWQPARNFIDKLVLQIPLLNNLILYSNYSNFLSVLSVSYDAGIPIVDCLHLGVITLTNSVLRSKISEASYRQRSTFRCFRRKGRRALYVLSGARNTYKRRG